MLTSCPRCQYPTSPEPSPSAPLSFLLPPVLQGPSHLPPTHPETDLTKLKAALARLRLSGWYHEGLTWRGSISALAHTPLGTFLVRDSSDPRFLFSLSVQTLKGPTSVRIHYVHGCFRLDADPSLVAGMPLFDCVVALVQYYIDRSEDPGSTTGVWKDHVWMDRTGSVYSDLYLRRPLYRGGTFPSLQHLSRLAVNALPSSLRDSAPLPITLRSYLKEYPYTR